MNQAVSLEHRKLQISIGGTVLLVSFAMLFATLFLGYAVYRFSSPTWPPQGFMEISPLWPGISTLIILLSSITLELCHHSFQKSLMTKTKLEWWLTFLLGMSFMGSQIIVWRELNDFGIFYNSGILGSILHGFTWIHAAHVVLGLIALLYLRPVLKLDSFEENQSLRFGLIKKFWHFLGIVWLVMFVGLFLI